MSHSMHRNLRDLAYDKYLLLKSWTWMLYQLLILVNLVPDCKQEHEDDGDPDEGGKKQQEEDGGARQGDGLDAAQQQEQEQRAHQ